MRPFTSTLPFAEAFRIMMDAAVPIARTETIGLVEADGRVVAADAIAAVDVPPFDRAAMDGYAVIAGDTAGATRDAPKTLTCAGRLFTGEVALRPVGPGECLEIATGAPMPGGADAVVIVEETTREGDAVRIRESVRRGQNVGRRAADIAAGAVTATTGQVLTPSRIGALAATGVAGIEVFARPSVAILSTGDEIVEPGEPLAPGQIYDVNRYTLETVVLRHGGVAAARPISSDSLDELIAALDEAAAHDIVVVSGGSSVGDRDLIRDALAARGDVRFHGIAVKPGKPTAFATVGGTPVFAMPGYPTSCLSNAYMLLVPFLRAVARLPAWQPRTIEAPLARRIASATARLQFYTVRIANGAAEPAFKASGDITSMADADGYIEIPPETSTVEAGTMVTVKLF
jgi:molybdenum cofactor synthesis domain-containing protein